MILAAVRKSTESDERFLYRVEEMKGLIEAAGAQVVQVLTQARDLPHPALYLGAGKVIEIADAVEETQAELVILDGELSPAQVRNLESRIGCRIVDRTQLILDIFATRANTREGRLQVEIAQLRYRLPRLTGRGIALSRQGGGIGTRGPGETQLETDRRRIRDRISHLKAQLAQVRKTRNTQRRKRHLSVPVIALVGYTNAGKTTLLRRWTQDQGSGNVQAGNQRLFDTLDPLARRVKTGVRDSIVVMDTVGFVSDLPHLLVDAFWATLEEVLAADLIVHVVDATADVSTHLATTYRVLREIGVQDKPIITFFNKMDAAPHRPAPDTRAKKSVYGAAIQGDLQSLYDAVDESLGTEKVMIELAVPEDAASFWPQVMKNGRVLGSRSDDGETVQVTVELERRHVNGLLAQLQGAETTIVDPMEW